jgi:hypothetical protein
MLTAKADTETHRNSKSYESALTGYRILTSQGYYYFIFGFATIVSILTLVITVEVSIVCTYVQLCAEDYRWW